MAKPKLILPEHYDTTEAQTASEEATARAAKQLPDPSGYRILCSIPQIDKAYESGLLKADITVHNEELLTTVLFVVKLGPDCYADKTRFPSGPWCKEGDFVLVRPHAGTRVKIHGMEFRIINDDAVEAVVEDPRGIRRA
jgi:co-chaperonin GroES (HSP10)